MAAIPEDLKIFIVTSLACFDSPKQVMQDVKEQFCVVVTSQQLSAYDPNTQNGKRLSKPFKALFEQTREQFLKDATKVPIANAAVRLRKLQRLYESAEARGNMAMAAQLLEQAAKETGGAFTNRRELGGAVGAVPIPPPQAGSGTTDEAYKKMLGGAR
jgi:hypothetical protein